MRKFDITRILQILSKMERCFGCSSGADKLSRLKFHEITARIKSENTHCGQNDLRQSDSEFVYGIFYEMRIFSKIYKNSNE